ncbi:MAG: C40 family peptidase [Acidimicrobiia bacterium]
MTGFLALPLLFGACVPAASPAPALPPLTGCSPYDKSIQQNGTRTGAPTLEEVQANLAGNGTNINLPPRSVAAIAAMERTKGCAKYNDGSPRLGPKQFDCSGLVIWSYAKALGKLDPDGSASLAAKAVLPNDSAGMWTAAQNRTNRLSPVQPGNELPGDLVFYDTDRDGSVNHVAIVAQKGWIVHAEGTPYGLTIKSTTTSTSGYFISTSNPKFRGIARYT